MITTPTDAGVELLEQLGLTGRRDLAAGLHAVRHVRRQLPLG